MLNVPVSWHHYLSLNVKVTGNLKNQLCVSFLGLLSSPQLCYVVGHWVQEDLELLKMMCHAAERSVLWGLLSAPHSFPVTALTHTGGLRALEDLTYVILAHNPYVWMFVFLVEIMGKDPSHNVPAFGGFSRGSTYWVLQSSNFPSLWLFSPSHIFWPWPQQGKYLLWLI